MLQPFKRSKDKVAIVGFSETSRHLAPYDNPDFEIWGLNEEYNYEWMKRFDRWFQLHPRWDFTRENNPNHWNHILWLKNQSGTCLACRGTKEVKNQKNETIPCENCKDGVYTPPEYRKDLIVYMQDKFDDIPNSVKFPKDEITEHLLFDLGYDYYTSSPAYMIALAIALNFKEIRLYGFDMGSDTEYHYQRACFEFWVGRAMGAGIKVLVPPESLLLKGKLYGYENMRTGFRQDLELRKVFLNGRLEGDKIQMFQQEGRLQLVKYILEKKLFTKEQLAALYEEVSKDHAKAQATVNFKRGAEIEVEQMTKMYDAYFRKDGQEDLKPLSEEYVHLDYQLGSNDAQKTETD